MFSRFSTVVCNDYDDKNTIIFFITGDYNVYSVGTCRCGYHGHKEEEISIPTQINNLSMIKMIDCGFYHTLCCDYNGNAFSFGNNKQGQLGIGKESQDLQFTNCPQKLSLPPIKLVSCTYFSSFCLTEDGLLYSFGDNVEGELGLGNNESYNSPQLITDLNDIEYMVCGSYHVICKTNNNEFYSWGYNDFGQLGRGNIKNCNKPIQCLNWPSNIINIKSGGGHVLLLTVEGNVYSFGDNGYGQLGLNDKNIKSVKVPTLINNIPEIQRIECGDEHSNCVDIDNSLWSFGYNTNGQLGLGDVDDIFIPTLHTTLSNIIDISSGGYHTFVKTLDNKIYAFGASEIAQLGIKTSENQFTPVQVLEGNENIWNSTTGKSSQKSARK